MTLRAHWAPIVLLGLSLVAPAAAQNQLVQRPASINGESITLEDVRAHAGLVNQEIEGLDAAQLFHVTRRRIAEEILLAGEAERCGVELDQRQVDAFWANRNGKAPDYEGIAEAAGTSVARQKVLGRRAALASLYLYNKCGLRSDFGTLVPPDPNLVREVKITPSQLREAFQANKQYLDQPALVRVELYYCRDEDEASRVPIALAAGKQPEGVGHIERAYPSERLEEVAEPELVAFLRGAQPGDTQRYDLDQGILLAVLETREPAHEATFAASQDRLRNLLVAELLADAQQRLVRQLAQQATFWPRDLFQPPPKSPDGELAEPVGPVAKPPSGP